MSKVWLQTGVLEKLKEIDSLVLDIDGVIVAVGESFRQAICQGVQFYLTKIKGWVDDQEAILPQETELFKQAGGFNNDWDLALAVVMLYLKKNKEMDKSEISTLRNSGWSIEEYTYHLAQAGGGLGSVEKVLQEKIALEVQEEVAIICKEIYAGEEFYQELYGGTISYVQGHRGLIHKEEILLDTAKLLASQKKIAIITGRNWREAKLVLNRVGLLSHIPREHILTDDDGLRKPDPRTLDLIGQRLQTGLGVFIGDTLDDLRTTKGTKIPWLAASVLSGGGGPEGEKIFRQEGSHLIAPEINSLLDLLSGKGEEK